MLLTGGLIMEFVNRESCEMIISLSYRDSRKEHKCLSCWLVFLNPCYFLQYCIIWFPVVLTNRKFNNKVFESKIFSLSHSTTESVFKGIWSKLQRFNRGAFSWFQTCFLFRKNMFMIPQWFVLVICNAKAFYCLLCGLCAT